MDKHALISKYVVITGDLNFHRDVPTEKQTKPFVSALQMHGMQQHVCEPTHVHGHTLDVVITRELSNVVDNIFVSNPGLYDYTGRCSKDHYALTLNMSKRKPQPVVQTVTYRKLRAIDTDSFKQDIRTSIVLNPADRSLDSL